MAIISFAAFRNRVEKKNKKSHSINGKATRGAESLLQEACVNWFREEFPQYRRLLFSIPNGGFRTPESGAVMKKEGMMKGAADLLLLIPSSEWCGLAIEMKTETGELSTYQLNWAIEVLEAGYCYSIVRSKEVFKNLIMTYLQ